MLQNTSTFYRRPITATMVPLISSLGKKMFRESMNAGYMEAYLHLSDQFVTQAEPFTCGPSSLVMTLNALEIDPRTPWKGIWRWFSEENLHHLPRMDQPLTVSMFAELAKANSCSVQLFYHDSVKHITNWNKHNDTCSFETHKDSCHLPHSPVTPKSASLSTFRHTVAALSRVSGCYPIINYDRKLVGQTGEGHFSPITGYHQAEDKSLVLDVARYKYPSHWVDIPTVYESLSSIDPQSMYPRGFAVVCRSVEMFPDICRLAQDYSMMKEFSIYFNEPTQKNRFIEISKLTGQEKVITFLKYLNEVPTNYINLLTLFVIQLTFSMETMKNDVGKLLSQELDQISKQNSEFEQAKFVEADFSELSMLQIVRDYQPEMYKAILAFIYTIFIEELAVSKQGMSLGSMKHLQNFHRHLFH